MRHLDGLSEFCAVVDEGGFTRAAERLGVSASYVSRRVSDLEARLGVKLLNRTTRQVNLTDLGQRYHEQATAILGDIATLEADMAEQQNLVKGRIRIAAGGRFGETHVAEALAAFARLHPDVEIELMVSDRRVDIAAERFDLAVRHGMPEDPDLVVRRIAQRRMIVAAAPGYLDTQGVPSVPDDLRDHACLLAPGQVWRFAHDGKAFAVDVRGRWSSNNGRALAIACAQSLGIVRLAETYLAHGIDAGDIVPILEPYEVPPQETVLAFPSRDHLPYRVRTLIGHLSEALRVDSR